MYWAILAAAIATSMAGQTLLKAGAAGETFLAQLLDWRTILGLGLYGGAAILYIVALRRIPMSVALPFTAASYVAALLIGHYGFGEPLSIQHIAAIALICAGVVLLAFAWPARTPVDAAACIPGPRDSLGRIEVDPFLRAPALPQVFVTGDAAAADTGDGHVALQSCQHALRIGRAAGANAASDLLGLPLQPYTQLRYGTCLDLGRFGAVRTAGWNREVIQAGPEAKPVKRTINTQVIDPPANATRAELLAQAE